MRSPYALSTISKVRSETAEVAAARAAVSPTKGPHVRYIIFMLVSIIFLSIPSAYRCWSRGS